MGGPRVAGPDRVYDSVPLVPPAIAKHADIRRVQWRYGLPAGRRLVAELCAGAACIPLRGSRGGSNALAGTSADTPLRFHFRLPAGERRALAVGTIQLLVDYR